MRHISKATALFGIGALALILAVLGTVAAPGTASADEPARVQASTTEAGEQCVVSTFTRRVFGYEHVFEETRINNICGTLCTLYLLVTFETVERTVCGERITERVLSSVTDRFFSGSEFDPDSDQSGCSN